MDGLSLSTVGWIALVLVVLALLMLAVRYFMHVAVELARVLLVAIGAFLVIVFLWLLLSR